MVNKLVDIGGQDRPVNFGRNAHAEIESITGISILDIATQKRVTTASFTYARAMAYAGLKWGLYDPKKGVEPKPDFTLFQVGDWLEDNDGVESAMSKIVSIWTESLPLQSKKNAGKESELNGQKLTAAPSGI